jgi:serine/threonine-protein kinase
VSERTEPERDAPPGVRLLSGRYRLGQILGYGGMAEVYRARDIRLDRDVAVKMLRSDLARDPAFQARFRREAQSAAGLNHPMIVSVYDTGEDQSHAPPLPYIVMEYVPGHTLREVLLTGGRVTPDRAIEIVMGVCEALEYSHRSGIVHRDIKPGNVMILPDGSIKVMDFGIARAVAQSTSTVTQTAAVMGTAQYLSPEQARGEKVDARSDLYSAGVVLYELLTGQPPFQGDSPVAVAYQHVRESAVPPSDLDGELSGDTKSDDIDAVVMKALAKNPANRYQTAGQFRDDLGRILTGRRVLATPLLREPVSRPPATARRRPRDRRRARRALLLVGALVLLAAGAVVGGLLLARSSHSDEQPVVPPVRGLSLQAAEKLITENGLRWKAVPVKNSAAVDTVLGSDPVVGKKVARNSIVTLTYSSGPGDKLVPADLVGLAPQDAEQKLRMLGFRYSVNAVQGLNVPPGRVASTSPLGGAKADPRTVTVVLNVANDRTTVPDLFGDSLAVAQSKLDGADLQVQVVETNSLTSDGQVLAQSVPPQTVVARSSVVTITVTHLVKPSPTPTPTTKRSPTPSSSPSAAPSGKPSKPTASAKPPPPRGSPAGPNR